MRSVRIPAPREFRTQGFCSSAGGRTGRHYHKIAEELYFILEGAGEMELRG